MIAVRLGLLSLLCGACFHPQGKAEETGATEASSEAAGSSTSTSAGVTTTQAQETTTEETPTTEAVVGTSTGSTTEAGESTTGTTTEAGTTETTAEETSSGGEESTGGVMPMCGNGKLETGEACDDGNTVDDDGCPGDCKSLCGNGVLDVGEACDDGDLQGGDGCSAVCVRDAGYVFVTSKLTAGDFGGLPGADQMCATAAKEGGLPGTYRAWLSDDMSPAITRLKPLDMPYVRTDGVPVAASFAEIVQGNPEKLKAPIALTELKQVIKPGVACDGKDTVWTGTDSAGLATLMANCNNWTNAEAPANTPGGSLSATSASWTQGCALTCSQGARLYCFEVAQ